MVKWTSHESNAQPVARANAGIGPAISVSASPLDRALSFGKSGSCRTPRGSSLTLGKITSMRCTKCNSEVGEKDRVLQVGHLEVYRCPQCAHEISGTASHVLPDSFFDATPVRAILRWPDPPSASEVAALRKIVPEFAAMGLSEVTKAIAGRASWTLGVFPRAYVRREVAPFVEQHRFHLELEPA